jgi:hypothetical protein
MLDLSDAPEQRPGELIPDGTFAQLKLAIRPGGHNIVGADVDDLGIFKASERSDAVMLDCELSVLRGPHSGRKLWTMLVVAGGRLDEAGNSKGGAIAKATMRAMVDSALGLDPKDASDATKAKRRLPNYRSLDGIEFFAKIGIEQGGPAPNGGTYPDKNIITHIVVLGEPQYAALKAGQEMPPAPSGLITPARTAAAPAPAQPAWMQQPQQQPAAIPQAAPAQGPSWLRR